MAKFCHKCGTQAIDDESVFCTKCGTQYIQNIPEKKDDVCPKCGTKILDKQSVFCNKCGSQVSTISPVTDQQVDEQPVVAQPIIKRKRCPACGVPFVNENKYYCDSCGAYLRGSSPINLPQSKKVVTPDNRSTRRNVDVKSPFLAVLLSFFIPGAGQCYTDQWWKGIALFIFGCFSAVLCIIVIGIFPLIAIWLYSMYDAYRAANRINGDFVDVNGTYNKQNIQQNTRPKKSGVNLGLVIIGAGVLLFIVLIAVAILSQSGNLTSFSLRNSATDTTITTKDLSSMALTINDFPTGWKMSSTISSNSTTYHNQFSNVGDIFDASVVYLNMFKYDTIDEAKTQYNSKKGKITTVKVESVNLGNEGFGYIDSHSEFVVFRTGNIITQVQYGVYGYMGLYPTLDSLNDAKLYAEIVAKRIK
ncbi:MAG: zinc ribbon domain-containing protein [Methanoregula sp.]|nr:zinc ribbon domain-containing protein [Methanoregula sp.]